MKNKILSIGLAVIGLAGLALDAGAQTYLPITPSTNNIPSASTNNVASSVINNGALPYEDIYYSFNCTSTNGTVTIQFGSQPTTGAAFIQVPGPYLVAGTTNQISVATPSAVTVTTGATNITGIIRLDTSHGQAFEVISMVNTGVSGVGPTNLTLNAYSPR